MFKQHPGLVESALSQILAAKVAAADAGHVFAEESFPYQVCYKVIVTVPDRE
jgi:hypothetical protein